MPLKDYVPVKMRTGSSTGPATQSLDYKEMSPHWNVVDRILAGRDAMITDKALLPKFEGESEASHKNRLDNARFTNIFRDIVENLTARLFNARLVLSDGDAQPLRDFAEDVDGCGNTVHQFSSDVAFHGISRGLDWILVDYSADGETDGLSREQERQAGHRPIWRRYSANNVIAAESAYVDGEDVFTHVRLLETAVTRDGWEDTEHERVRVLNREPVVDLGSGLTTYGPATWDLYQYDKTATDEKKKWVLIDSGVFSIGVIPLVPFLTGRRKGKGWQIYPPMKDAADLQLEYYQQENALKHIKTMCAYPMLSGNGVSPDVDADGNPKPIVVGPQTVLYATAQTANGSSGTAYWSFVEPTGESLRYLSNELAATSNELRELGRMPLTAQSTNLTVVTTAYAAKKAGSAVQAWAFTLKDAVQRCMRFTAMWLLLPEQEYVTNAVVTADFDLGLGDDNALDGLIGMYNSGIIDWDTVIHEAKRRALLDKDRELVQPTQPPNVKEQTDGQVEDN